MNSEQNTRVGERLKECPHTPRWNLRKKDAPGESTSDKQWDFPRFESI